MRTMNKWGVALVTAFTAMTIAMPAMAAEEVQKDGVTHIMNSATPANGHRTVTLEEEWRVGGEDGEDFFGMISQVLVGDDNLIYLLDTRLSEVPVYDTDGVRVNTLSREGDGPGESRTPSNMLFMPDGNLGLVQVFPGKIITIATDGTPSGDFTPGGGGTAGGFMTLFDTVSNGEHVVATGESIKMAANGTGQDRVNFVAAFDKDGAEVVRYFENAFSWDFTNFELNEDEMGRVDFRRVTAGPDGRMYIATQRNAYEITVFNQDGTLDRVINREYEHVMRTEAELARVNAVAEAQLAQVPNAKITMSHSEPDLAGMNFGPDGNLWVATSRGGIDQADGVLFTWDVFSPDGEFLEMVSAACEGDGDNDLLMWTNDGAAIQVTGFQEAVEALQSQGAGGTGEEEDDGEAEPMEVIYLKIAG
ncbi:MAG: hypothetical protein ACI9UK_000005 [Candidatus Krumholzibacteriia bacterium]|jgi:hypothetical protein